MRTFYVVLSAINFAAALAFPPARIPFLIATFAFMTAAVALAVIERRRG